VKGVCATPEEKERERERKDHFFQSELCNCLLEVIRARPHGLFHSSSGDAVKILALALSSIEVEKEKL